MDFQRIRLPAKGNRSERVIALWQNHTPAGYPDSVGIENALRADMAIGCSSYHRTATLPGFHMPRGTPIQLEYIDEIWQQPLKSAKN